MKSFRCVRRVYDGVYVRCIIIAVAGENMAVKVNNDHTSSRLHRRARLNSNYIFMCFHHQKWFFMFLSFIFFDGSITTIFRSLSTFYVPPRHFFSLHFFCIAGNKVLFFTTISNFMALWSEQEGKSLLNRDKKAHQRIDERYTIMASRKIIRSERWIIIVEGRRP